MSIDLTKVFSDEEIENKIKNLSSNIKQNEIKLDQDEIKKKVEEVTKNIVEKAEQIEKKMNFEENIKKITDKMDEFLFETTLHSTNFNGISMENYINYYEILNYKPKNGPNSSYIYDLPTQLVLINKLGKLMNYQFIKTSDESIKFNDLDLNLSKFIQENKIETYKISYDILFNLMKKLLILSLSDVESAFRSNKIWLNKEFKTCVTPDVIMMNSLNSKFLTSSKIFLEELFKIKESKIFNNTKILGKLLNEIKNFELEEILARSIKSMSPLFILDYFYAIKTIYLSCSMLNIYFHRLQTKEIEYNKSDLKLIVAVCNIFYQNTRLKQNGIVRQLPMFKGEISELTQMYYLNHTVVGPQFILLKVFEESIISLDKILS